MTEQEIEQDRNYHYDLQSSINSCPRAFDVVRVAHFAQGYSKPKRARQERDHFYDQLPTQNISVVFCKYLYTGKLSFFACLAENPGPILAAAEGCVNRVDEAEVAGFE